MSGMVMETIAEEHEKELNKLRTTIEDLEKENAILKRLVDTLKEQIEVLEHDLYELDAEALDRDRY